MRISSFRKKLANLLTDEYSIKSSGIYKKLEAERDELIKIRDRRGENIRTMSKRIRATQSMYVTIMDVLKRYGTLEMRGEDKNPKEVNIFSQETLEGLIEGVNKLEKVLNDKNSLIATLKTELKTGNTKLRDYEKAMVPKDALEHASEEITKSFIYLDSSFNVAHYNEGAEELFSNRIGEINYFDLFYDSKELTRFKFKLQEEEPFTMDVNFKQKGGMPVRIKTRTIPLPENRGYVVITREDSFLHSLTQSLKKYFVKGEGTDLDLGDALPESS